ncbi:Bug family tripartite tricarboxylate transporter substrate binding protein [Xenophilus arseniciresistens]|uniref:Bug family tripartite tricarboxylate transporter substrate binding protein n=1 Tax=Xenophilus arseniciresistens TaxID=1283306 RepID=A0AAE3SYC4_9BURK|nr:Bug family tripartite tricarboxylate transporter substrate binding protein [Xenophilus arseniciresistens]MDA7415952.1 Bug family tripartite tricarboxylate transporter substrate binding protein [Xenophilus arseniciresistens]
MGFDNIPHFGKLLRRTFLASALLAAGLAQAQPGAPVKLLVGFPAGAGTDAIARLLAEKLKDELGAPVVVENRAGAGGQIAANALKTAPPDGHTFFVTHDHSISILPQVIKNPGFNPATDFVPVAGFATFANVLAVSGGTPAKTYPEYLNWVKTQRGGKDTIGVPAPGSIPEFLVKLIAEKSKLDLQAAPYRGGAPMMADMLGNQIAAGISSVPDMIEHHRAGKMRIVATIGAKRDPLLPSVPTFTELGFSNLNDYPWYGVFAPTGTPQPIVDKFGNALQKVLAMPDVKTKLTDLGLTVGYEPQGQFSGRVRSYTQTWAGIIKASGFQPQ